MRKRIVTESLAVLLFLSSRALIAQMPSLSVASSLESPNLSATEEWDGQFRLGEKYYDQEHFLEAEQAFRSALAAADQIPGDASRRGKALTSLGKVLINRGRLDAASEALLTAVATLRQCGGDACSLSLATALHSLAVVSTNQGRLAEAEALIREALEWYARIHASTSETSKALETFGWIEVNRGRFAAAEYYFRRGISLLKNVQGAESRRGHMYGSLSNALLGLHHNPEAVEAAELGLDAVSFGTGSRSEDVVTLACTLAEAALAMDNFVLAERSLARAEEALSRLRATKTRELGMYEGDMAYLRYRQKRYEEADQFLSRAIGTLGQYLSQSHPQMLTMKTNHAILLRKLKRREQAQLVEAEVRSLGGVVSANSTSKQTVSVSDLRQNR